MGKRLTRNFCCNVSLFRYVFIAFWISSLYITYFYASNQSPEVKVSFPVESHRIRGAKSLYEYAYHEKVKNEVSLCLFYSLLSCL